MKKKMMVATLLILLAGITAQAQSTGSTYKTAVGIKFYPGAVSVKSFIKENKAIEGLGYLYSDGFRLTGLYEIHGDIEGVDGLKWYGGPGAHIAAWNNNWKDQYPTRDGGIAIGIDGVLGLDYKFNGLPINVSLDWQPSFNFVGYNYFEGGWGGLAIRYTL
jgi:hypothetical protein